MRKDELIGIYQGTGRGYGFFIPEDGSPDWFVPPHRDGGAWDGDTVKLRPDWDESKTGTRTVGSVAAVLTRANRDVVGTVQKVNRDVWLVPDNSRLPMIRLIVKKGKIGNGDKASAHITSYGGRGEPPMGRLAETFGRADSREAAVKATLYRYDIDPYFPPDVQFEAEKTPAEVPADAIEGRRDLRDMLIITIDGASAKDLDDAVSLSRDERGRTVLGVHIADVSHYVRENSALDMEAWERGTSVYFADQVVPMLPKELSNVICSLNPHVDRLTLTCFMTINSDGKVVDHELCKSVIRTAERMTYKDCNDLLDGNDETLNARYTHILPVLREMAALAAKLERQRRLRGSLNLESQEAVILCNELGQPVAMELREQGRSEKLIEEFMLAANETVAKHLHDLDKPAVYRIHEKPSADKTERLGAMLSPFGLDVKQADHFTLQKVLDEVRGKPEAPIVSAMMLRSMMKARYDEENLGHFGLAADYYCHFTSPIRRYPDLMVHRILTALLENRLHGSTENKLRIAAQKAAAQSSERELSAQNAEREIGKFYAAEFMQGHVGERFPGTVSGVSRAGVFVTLPFGAEGLIPIEALPDYDFDYDEQRMTLTGRKGTVFSFGMTLEVICVAANPGTGEIDFRLEGTPSISIKHKGEHRTPPKSKQRKTKKPPKWKRR